MLGFLKSLFGGGNTVNLEEIVGNGAFLVDVRTPGEFAGGSAKGAVNIPLNKISTQLNKFKGKENIVLFCKSGMRSAQAKSILERNGFQNVVNGGSVSRVSSLLKK